MLVQIALFDGFDEMDVIGPYEVLHSAAAEGADLRVELAPVRQAESITAAHGLCIRPQGRLAVENRPDVLIVPGGNYNNPAATCGVRQEIERGELPRLIGAFHKAGTILAGVCTGAMLIGAAGLLSGRPAITHHVAVKDLMAMGVEIVPGRVVDDRDIVTSGGVTSGLDLGLWLVERLVNSRIAQRVERRMEYERRGVVWQR